MSAAVRIARHVLAIGATAAAMFALAGVSAAPVRYHAANSGRLRLSWNARPERIEVCRTLTPEEIAQRPEHMRQRVVCDGRFATYALQVDADGRRIDGSVVQGAGLRHDRSLYLLRDFDLLPGAHRIRVSFARREQTDDDAAAFAGPAAASGADTGLFAGRAQREAAEHARRAGAAIPARLLLDTTLTFVSQRVTIVTFDHEHRALVVLGEDRTPR